MILPPLASHDLVVLWVELAALLAGAHLFGALARRLRQPPVVGNLLAGLLLGPSVLGQLSPTALHWFLPAGHTQGDLLQAVSQVALLVLLVVAGAETDLPLIRALGPAALSVSLSSLLVPVGAGLVAAAVLPAAFRGAGASPVSFDLLVAGVVGVSSLPVVARIVGDQGLMRRNFAQLAVAAGTANDVAGFLLATAATGLAASHAGSGSAVHLALAIAGLVVVTVVIFRIGQPVVDAALRQVRRQGPNVGGSLAVTLVAAFAAAAGAQAFGIEGALGGFLAGIVIGRSRFQQGAGLQALTRFTDAVLAPVFFATAGLRVNLETLGSPPVLLATAALVGGAMIAKFAGSLLGARLVRLPWREGAALGVALNGRGTMQVIIAGAGLTIGAFTPAAYSAAIVLAIVSSVAVAPVLAPVVKGWSGSTEERARLDEETRLDANLVVRQDRLLLATAGSPSALVAGAVLNQAWPRTLPATVLAVEGPRTSTGDEGGIRGATWMFSGRPVERRTVTSDDVLDTILAETKLGYGVLGLGASEVPGSDRLLSAVVDDIMVRCPLPMVIARRALSDPSSPPTASARRGRGSRRPGPADADDIAFSRILLPVTGSSSSRAAQEVALGLARARRARVNLLHVVTRVERGQEQQGRPATRAGQGVLRDAERFAARHDVPVRSRARHAPEAGAEIVRLAAESEADAIVLGAAVRSLAGRPFLGHTTEHVLAHASCAVVVVALPVAVPDEAARRPDRPAGSGSRAAPPP